MTAALIGKHWTVRPIEHAEALVFIEREHYAKGASLTLRALGYVRTGAFHKHKFVRHLC